jgi:magnesium chelatase family protein
VEVNSGWGDTVVVIVRLPDAAVKESRHRVSTVLANSRFKFPMGRCTINLAPADVKKQGQNAFCLRERPRRSMVITC